PFFLRPWSGVLFGPCMSCERWSPQAKSAWKLESRQSWLCQSPLCKAMKNCWCGPFKLRAAQTSPKGCASENVFLQDPVVSFDLSEVCRTALNLEKIADFICSKLSEATQGDFPEQMWFVMLDLAAWHADRGEEAEVRRLWHLAHSAPKRMQDPRVLSHFYGWRFDNEPG
ncbi:ABC transporter A family member 1, partial [Durusdinium trenchii]